MEEIEKDIVQKKHKYYENGTMKVSLGKIEWTQDNEQPKKEMMFMIWQKKKIFKATTVSYLKKEKFETSRKKYESHGSESKLNYGQIWHKMKNRNIHNRNMSLWVAQRSWHWNVAHSFPIRWTRLLMYVLSANIIGVKENSLN